ncbi:hypothetical protein RSPPQCQH_CDS0010 [Mycolicibacterium phage phi1_186001]
MKVSALTRGLAVSAGSLFCSPEIFAIRSLIQMRGASL